MDIAPSDVSPIMIAATTPFVRVAFAFHLVQPTQIAAQDISAAISTEPEIPVIAIPHWRHLVDRVPTMPTANRLFSALFVLPKQPTRISPTAFALSTAWVTTILVKTVLPVPALDPMIRAQIALFVLINVLQTQIAAPVMFAPISTLTVRPNAGLAQQEWDCPVACVLLFKIAQVVTLDFVPMAQTLLMDIVPPTVPKPDARLDLSVPHYRQRQVSV